MSDFLIVAALVAGGLAAGEIGYRVGVAWGPREKAFGSHLDLVRGAVFALVAFLIGFAFAGAGSRYVDRMDIVVTEANALGTAWLRADLLAEPQRAELKAALREYTADRVHMLSIEDRAEIMARLAKVGPLHARMWTAGLAGTKDNAPLAQLVLAPLNEVFDLHTSHLALVYRSLPRPIMVVLLAITALSLFLVGFGSGIAGRHYRTLDTVYALVLSVALWMTFDLDRPRQGLIQISHKPLADTLEAMK